MEILTEFDELQAALAKVNMNESVFTYQNGRLIDSNAFNKTQKILNCPEMISAHKYLYELDMDQLTEEEQEKIDQLYKLGCDRGFIVDDLTKWDDEEGDTEEEQAIEVVEPVEKKPQNTLFKAKVPCWTVIYSATKDGDIKTGEAYSNAVSISAAKADVNAKLSQCGYDNISILAIENCTGKVDPFAVSMNEDDKDKADDDTSDDSSDDSSDEEESSEEDDSSNDSNEEESSDDEDSSSDEDESNVDSDEDDSEDDSNDEVEDDSSDSDKDDSSDEEESSDDEDDSNDEDSSSDDEKSDEDDKEDSDEDSNEEEKELDANEKTELRDLYRKTFKNTLVKCKFDTSFNDLTLEQKVKFFTELSKAWKKDFEPKDFMTDKEIEQLNNVVAQNKADND